MSTPLIIYPGIYVILIHKFYFHDFLSTKLCSSLKICILSRDYNLVKMGTVFLRSGVLDLSLERRVVLKANFVVDSLALLR